MNLLLFPRVLPLPEFGRGDIVASGYITIFRHMNVEGDIAPSSRLGEDYESRDEWVEMAI